MQIISFNLRKISADRSDAIKGSCFANVHLDFTNIEKENISSLNNLETVKFSFKFTGTYVEKEEKKERRIGEVLFEGDIYASTEKDELKDLLKQWKKKDVTDTIKIPIFNLIIKKCSARALQLEEEIGLPYHVQIPQISPNQQSNQSN